jgi:hypothetical protein
VLARRSAGCISDLTIDRWLLGETPGSDEARRVEEHMKGCAPCASRIGALRGLYATRAQTPCHEPPVRIERVPAPAPDQSGALQVLILRDGLLVGSEYFTPGTYFIGSDPRADLQLDAVLPLHARLYFRDGRVALEARQGALYVNQFKVTACEMRPIDEVLIGPYVLRSRVIRERWGEAHGSTHTTGTTAAPILPDEARGAEVHVQTGGRALETCRPAETPVGQDSHATATVPSYHSPLASSARLAADAAAHVRKAGPPAAVRESRVTLELWWGEARQEVRSFRGSVTRREFPLWGFTVEDDLLLAHPLGDGRFVVRGPTGGAPATLSPGMRTAFTAGAMRLVVSVDAVLEPLPGPELVSWPTVGLSGALLLAFFLALALAPESGEGAFPPHPIPKLSVTLVVPSRQAPPAAQVSPSVAEAHAEPRRPSPPPPPRRSMDRFSAVNDAVSRVLRGSRLATVLDSARRPAGPVAARRAGVGGLLAGLGTPAVASGLGLGTGRDVGAGIGARGFEKVGSMRGGGYGTGPVGGRVDRPSGRRVIADPGPGFVDREAVARAIADHLAEVSACYERSLLVRGHSGGRLSLEWAIGLDGSVSRAAVKSSTLEDASIAACVVERLKTWRFPRPRGGPVIVKYPFVFQASDF